MVDQSNETDGGYVSGTNVDGERVSGDEPEGWSSSGDESSGRYSAGFGSIVSDEQTGATRRRQLLEVARQEYRLSIRNRWALALTGLFALFSLLVVGFGGSSLGPGRVNAVIVSLASLATYLLPLAALAFGYDAVVGAQRDGWLDIVFALPTPRWTVILGMYLGRAATVAGSTAIGFGLAGLVLFALAGWIDATAYATFLLGAVGLGLAFLSISVLISTVAAEKTHALGIALLAWVWFVFVHDLLALAALSTFDLGDGGLSVLLLANPVDVFRILVLSQQGTTGGFAAVYTGVGTPTVLLVVALLAWCVVPVAVAARLVRRRSV